MVNATEISDSYSRKSCFLTLFSFFFIFYSNFIHLKTIEWTQCHVTYASLLLNNKKQHAVQITISESVCKVLVQKNQTEILFEKAAFKFRASGWTTGPETPEAEDENGRARFGGLRQITGCWQGTSQGKVHNTGTATDFFLSLCVCALLIHKHTLYRVCDGTVGETPCYECDDVQWWRCAVITMGLTWG